MDSEDFVLFILKFSPVATTYGRMKEKEKNLNKLGELNWIELNCYLGGAFSNGGW